MGTHERGPRLLTRVRRATRLRHYSRRTEKAYVGWIKRFIFFNGTRHPDQMGEHEVMLYLSDLAVRKRVSASTQNQAFSALLFLYREVLGRALQGLEEGVRAKRPQHLPVVLSRREVERVLDELRGPAWLVASLLYGSGLRLLECLTLRVKDLDLARGEITVRDGKGRKDRVTVLPGKLGAIPCYPMPWNGSTRTRVPSGRGSGSFPRRGTICIRDSVDGAATISTRPSSSEPSRRPCAAPASRSTRPATRCATRSQHICWKPATTSGRSRNCWVIATSRPR
jgi:hypothetical protein